MSIMASISCRHVKKVYPGNVTAVPDFSLEMLIRSLSFRRSFRLW